MALMLSVGIIIGLQMNRVEKSVDDEDTNTLATTEITNTEEPADTPSEEKDDSKAEHTASEKTAVENYGALSVTDEQLTDKDGNRIQLRGVSTHGLSWYPQYVSEDSFRFMRDTWDINLVRLAMYTADYNGYCEGDDNNRQVLKNVVSEGVNAATNLGMYVIIDWHILSDSNPLQNKDMAKEFFGEMSERYQGYSNVIYEICNEPNQGASWQDIKAYAIEVIPVIRNNNPDAIILVGTPTWSQDIDLALTEPITDYDNLMYVCHFYAATHKDDLRNKVRAAADAGLPLFVSEFGICDASGTGAIDTDEADKWIALLNEKNISFVAWNLSNKDETSAFFVPSCSKTSGYTDEDLTDSAKWFINSAMKTP